MFFFRERLAENLSDIDITKIGALSVYESGELRYDAGW